MPGLMSLLLLVVLTIAFWLLAGRHGGDSGKPWLGPVDLAFALLP